MAELKLRSVEFSKAVRGYSCEEVDTYLAYVNDQYALLARECVELRRKMTVQAAGHNEYREEALKEKEKIAAEAEALMQASEREAIRTLENAKLKAARFLADAETAAAGIIREAEKKAAEMVVPVPAVPVPAPVNADLIAAQDNIADRMVAEIESFRQSVFNMYAKHIEELEELGRLTDRFYESKEALSGGYAPATETEAEPTAEAYPDDIYPDEEEIYMPAADFAAAEENNTAEPEEDVLSSLYEEDEEEDTLFRIDWASHRTAGKTAAADVPAYTPADDSSPLFPEADGKPEKGEEDFLSDIASEYFSARPAADRPQTNDRKADTRKPDTLDDLFESEESRNAGLTGEFDFIYSTKKSADNVAQIRRQPLVDAQKPQKPKKHGNI